MAGSDTTTTTIVRFVNFNNSKNTTNAISDSTVNTGTIYFTTDKNIVLNGNIYSVDNSLIPDEASSSNQLADKLYVDNLLSMFETDHTVYVREMTETTASIAPNTFYIWGEVEELDITLVDEDEDEISLTAATGGTTTTTTTTTTTSPTELDHYKEYMFQFTSGDVATTLTLPDNITWYLDNNTILANRTYQVSIVNNLGVLAEF